MDQSSQHKRRRVRGGAQPTPFTEMTLLMTGRVREREPELRKAGLWPFLSELTIPQPSQSKLGEFIDNYAYQDNSRVPVDGHIVELSSETLSRVTFLPGAGGKDIASVDLPKEAPQWRKVFSGGLLSFDDDNQGWDLRDLKEPWKEWFLLIQERIEMSEGGFMEHCVACAALLAWMKGESFNWAEELRLRIRDEVHRKKTSYFYKLLSAGYLGMVCALTIVPSEVEMLGGDPTEFLLQPPMLLMPVPGSPVPPTIVEIPVMHVEAESSERVLPREEMPEEVRPVADNAELLSKLETLKTMVFEKERVIVEKLGMLTGLRSEVERLSSSNDNLRRQCEIHKEMKDLRVEEIEFERKLHEATKRDKEKLVKQLADQIIQQVGEKEQWEMEKRNMTERWEEEKAEWKDAWEREKKELVEREERREKTMVQKSQEVQMLQSQIATLKREEGMVKEITKQKDDLVVLQEQQKQTIGNLWAKVERLKVGLWTLESLAPPFPHLQHNYERQRDVMFMGHNLHLSQRVGPELFQTLWDEVSDEGYENLLVETIVVGDLIVTDPLKTLTIVGDIGARVFLYYADMEIQLQRRRKAMAEQAAHLLPRAP